LEGLGGKEKLKNLKDVEGSVIILIEKLAK